MTKLVFSRETKLVFSRVFPRDFKGFFKGFGSWRKVARHLL